MSTPAPDVVIIGAGIIGGSIAWRLAQSGLRVMMVDAGVMGGEASWAGAGMLAPGGEMETRDARAPYANPPPRSLGCLSQEKDLIFVA